MIVNFKYFIAWYDFVTFAELNQMFLLLLT